MLPRVLDSGMLGEAQLEAAHSVVCRQPDARAATKAIFDHLVETRLLTRVQVLVHQATILGLAVVDLACIEVPPEVLERVPRELAMGHRLLPLELTAIGVKVSG